MKLGKLVIAIALAAVTGLAAMAQEKPASGPENGTPKLVIASFTHDFGEVKPGTTLKYSFILKNQGKGDLLIQSVTPG